MDTIVNSKIVVVGEVEKLFCGARERLLKIKHDEHIEVISRMAEVLEIDIDENTITARTRDAKVVFSKNNKAAPQEITEEEYHVLQLCKGITLRDNSKYVAVVRARLRSGVERTCSLQSLPETMYQVRLQIGNTVKNCVFSKETDLFFIDREDKILMVKTFDPAHSSGCKKADLNELGVKDLSFIFSAFVVK